MPSYPDLVLCPYLAAYLFEIGPTMPGAMGNVPLPHSEIRAWMDNTGIELSAWEVRTLRQLSGEYLVAAQDAEKPSCKPPSPDSEDAKNLVDSELTEKLDLFLN